MRKFLDFEVKNVALLKKNMLRWASSHSKYCILDSNKWTGNKNELLAAVGSIEVITPSGNSFDQLKRFHELKKDWLFGHLAYDLKNELEKLTSEHPDGVGFPNMHFFQPEYVFILNENKLRIGFLPELTSAEKVEKIFPELMNDEHLPADPGATASHLSSISSKITKEEYLSAVNKIMRHISKGDIYEMNYCMEFFSQNTKIDPVHVFTNLNETSETPFSAFYCSDNKYLMCSSPERFIKKSGNKIISQPIKGTAKRGSTIAEDFKIKKKLSQNEKEKSENVMIVDLVRNDLSRTCIHVSAEELFRVYTFKQWHQMISTVSGELREGIHFTEVLKNAFPMGSMTGAPKVRAMELIEQYEKTKRGLYSGAVGYITPDGDFDFNVVIRSILYNSLSDYLSFQVGSAITFNSVPENEYEECLLKANGMFEALNIYQQENTDA